MRKKSVSLVINNNYVFSLIVLSLFLNKDLNICPLFVYLKVLQLKKNKKKSPFPRNPPLLGGVC